MSDKQFGPEVQARGYEKPRRSGGFVFLGLALKTDAAFQSNTH